ncbi:S1C family serine protease [Gemmata sp.]|uniref:S1C family serine protease n=1 Tax=Gemmata sp. TaxID=1914242 RepID=UPI003F706B23
MTARSLAAALVLAAVASPASAQISTNPKVRAPFKAVVTKATESTVRIRGDDKDIALGTIVFADGYIITKASELRGALSVRLSDGTEYEAKTLATHVPTDLAMIKIDVKDLTPVTFADSKKVPIGNWLVSAGPQSEAMAVGIVSHGTRPLTFPDDVIVNANRGFLGIFPVDEKDKDGKVIGAKIESLEAKGGAAKAGLKKDDVIVSLDGKETPGQETLRAMLENLRPGDSVKLKVLREGEEKEFKATLTGLPVPSRGDIQNSMGGALSGRRTGFPAVLQTDMVIEPKDCGGPVVDLDGKVLGVNIARAGRVETWILPSENIRPILAELKAGKSTASPKR